MLSGRKLRYTSSLSEEDFYKKCSQQKNWYHSYYFENGFRVRGDYDIGADIGDYPFPESIAGMRILDVGTGGGWFPIFFEQNGAEVTTIDARSYGDFDVYGQCEYRSPESLGQKPDRYDSDGAPIYDSPVSGAFWTMKEILNAQVRFRNSRVYELQPEMFRGQRFDMVFLGAILLHLRDPIGALMAARRVCSGQVIATTPVVLGEPEDAPPRQLLPWTSIDTISWWLPNEACFRHWFLAAGFRDVDTRRQVTLRCDLQHRDEKTGRVVNENQMLRAGRAFV